MHSTDFILETTKEKFHQKAKTAIFEFDTDHVIWEPSAPFFTFFPELESNFRIDFRESRKSLFHGPNAISVH